VITSTRIAGTEKFLTGDEMTRQIYIETEL